MIKKRVFEVAKVLGMPTRDLIRKLQAAGVDVRNNFSTVEDEDIDKILPAAMKPLRSTIKADPAATPAPAAGAPKPQAPPPPKPEPPKPQPPRPPQQQPPRPQQQQQQQGRPQYQQQGRPQQQQPSRPPQQQQRPPFQQQRPPATQQQPRPQPQPPRQEIKKPLIVPSAQQPPPTQVVEIPKPTQLEEKGAAQDDIYGSPAKRLEVIRKKEMERDKRGTKVTFFRKKAGKKGERFGGQEQGEGQEKEFSKVVRVDRSISVKELSATSGVKSSEIIKFLMHELGIMATINKSLDAEIASLLGERFGFRIEVKEDAGDEAPDAGVDKPEELLTRPPVVTIMGHVDHGKTRLLDTIRKTNVIDTESGGITQHIGAYQIEHKSRKITFLDTPGHESFTAMRARGAKVTDLAVLVVAADDGVMPQTQEAIDHARAAGVPILVAVNKIDKPQANIERTMRQLADIGLQPEDWGGDTVFVNISAKMGTNIEDLLDMIFLVTDLQELKANPARKAEGSIVEAQLDKGKGPVASVLIQRGTLRAGDSVVVGLTWGKIRAMENDRGERVDKAEVSMPVKIFGLDAVPQAGDRLVVLAEEKRAREIAMKRRLKDREEKMKYASRVTLQELFQKIKDGQVRELKVIIKGDVQGTLEAIMGEMKDIKHAEVRVNVIRSAVGDVKETDVMLAAASDAIIIGFHVSTSPGAATMAAHEQVEIRHYEVIYKLVEEVKQALVGMLAPDVVEEKTGKCEILKLFHSAQAGSIAGCRVTEGEISVGDGARLFRRGDMIHETKIQTLRRFKESVKSVKQGFECGLTLNSSFAIQEEDRLEFYRMVEKRRETLA